jgi:hypothetical protein
MAMLPLDIASPVQSGSVGSGGGAQDQGNVLDVRNYWPARVRVDDSRRRIDVREKGAIKMTEDNEKHRREKLRALRELRGQTESRQEPILEAPYEDTSPDRIERESADPPRRAKIRELLQRHRAEGGEALRPGDGRLRRALAGRGAGGGVGGNRRAARANDDASAGVADRNIPALSGEPAARGEGLGRLGGRAMLRRLKRAAPDDGNAAARAVLSELAGQGGPLGGLGSRAMLRRLIQARQNSGGSGSGANTRLLVSELQSCVQQLTKEVERLRSNRTGKASVKKRKSAVAGKKPRRSAKKGA